MEIVNDWKTLISFAKCPVLDVWQGSKYADSNKLADNLPKSASPTSKMSIT